MFKNPKNTYKLPNSYVDNWNKLLPDLFALQDTKFLLMVIYSDLIYPVHVFCDAFTFAYECVIYYVNSTKSTLIFSKPKVASLKIRTLSQLELTAIYLGVKNSKLYNVCIISY